MTKHITSLFLLLLLLVGQTLTARHIIGADFTYTCLGEISPGIMRYEFIMTVYRDCGAVNAADFDSPAYMGIHRGNLSNSTEIDSAEVEGETVIDIIPDTPACVNQFPSVCVESRVYKFTRDLPIINESYFITYQRCCRNNSISNLIDPGNLGATYYVEITPLAQNNCNNSPVFNNFPRLVVCSGIPLIEDQSATDADGDLLVYSLCSPLLGGMNGGGGGGGGNGCNSLRPRPSCGPPFDNAPMVVPDYTPTAPMGGMPTIGINSGTGLMTGTPNVLGQFVVTICIQEFRNGAPIGSMRREFQFNLADCGADVVAAMDADTLLGPQVYMVRTCGEKEILIQNQSMLGSPPADIVWKFNLNNGSIYTTTDANPMVVFPDTGTYRGVLYLNPGDICNDSAEVFVHITDGIEADFSITYDTCVAGPVSFVNTSVAQSGTKVVAWSFDNGAATSSDTDPQYKYKTPGTQSVSLYVADNDGCFDNLDSLFDWRPAPPYLIIQPNRFIECAPGDIVFTNLSNPVDSSYFVVWDYGDGLRDTGIVSPVHQYAAPGQYNVSLYITSPIGCEVADTFINLIKIIEPPVADFTYDTAVVYTNRNSTVTFTDLSVDAARWGWTFEPGVTSTQQNPTYTFNDTGAVQVLLVATHPEGCKDTISRWLDIVPDVRYQMPNAFTPNGDSNNDDFVGNGYTEYMRGFDLQIWSRWGELVFQTNDPHEAWNGTARNAGKLCQDGLYQYTMQYVTSRGKAEVLQGQVHLIR